MINYDDEAKKRKGKTKNSSLYKSETNLQETWCVGQCLMWCVGQCWEKCHSLYIKKDIQMSL